MQERLIYHKLNPFKRGFIILCILISINCYSNIYLGLSQYTSNYPIFITLFMALLILFNKRKISNNQESIMQTVVIWTLTTGFLSFIPAYVDYGQSLITSIVCNIRLMYGLFIYFILRIWKASPKEIISILTIITLIWVFIEIAQQFTYPSYWFLGRTSIDDFVEKRMGLWRFYIFGIDLVMLTMSIYIGIIFTKNKTNIIELLCMLVLTIGVLCYCSRKHIYTTISAFAFATYYVNKKKRTVTYFMLIVAALVIFNMYYDSFQEMNKTATEMQGSGENFVRLITVNFFINDFSDSPLYPIMGAGIGGNSALGIELERLKSIYHIYQSDCGIIGYYSMFGLLGVSAIFLYIFKFIKNWKYIDVGYKIFFMMKLLLIVFDFWAMWASGFMAYAIFLYLLDCNINYNKTKYHENRNLNFL